MTRVSAATDRPSFLPSFPPAPLLLAPLLLAHSSDEASHLNDINEADDPRPDPPEVLACLSSSRLPLAFLLETNLRHINNLEEKSIFYLKQEAALPYASSVFIKNSLSSRHPVTVVLRTNTSLPFPPPPSPLKKNKI